MPRCYCERLARARYTPEENQVAFYKFSLGRARAGAPVPSYTLCGSLKASSAAPGPPRSPRPGGPELDQWCRVWVDRFELRETEDTIGLPAVNPSCNINFADIIGKTPDTFPVLKDGAGFHSIQCQCQLPAPPPLRQPRPRLQ